MNAKDLTKEDLKAIFDSCMDALGRDDLDAANEFFTEAMKNVGMEDMSTPEAKQKYLQMAKSMIPITCEADKVEVDGDKVTLYLHGTFNDIFDPGKITPQDVDILFTQEGGAWKMGKILLHDHEDKSTMKKSPDLAASPESDFDKNQSMSLGCAISSVAFEKTHTLVTLEMFDEQTLVYLPAKEHLGDLGLTAERLVVGDMIRVQGRPHKADKHKVLAYEVEM